MSGAPERADGGASVVDRIFERFPAFVREYIYAHGWESLRAVQVAAAQTLFLTDHHLLLTSSTASGKTEAAFFPILSSLYERRRRWGRCISRRSKA